MSNISMTHDATIPTQRFPSFGENHLPSHVMYLLSPDNLNTFSWAGPLLPNFRRVIPFCIGRKSKSSFLALLLARSSSWTFLDDIADSQCSLSTLLYKTTFWLWRWPTNTRRLTRITKIQVVPVDLNLPYKLSFRVFQSSIKNQMNQPAGRKRK